MLSCSFCIAFASAVPTFGYVGRDGKIVCLPTPQLHLRDCTGLTFARRDSCRHVQRGQRATHLSLPHFDHCDVLLLGEIVHIGF